MGEGGDNPGHPIVPGLNIRDKSITAPQGVGMTGRRVTIRLQSSSTNQGEKTMKHHLL
jgi:hypothetical protein